MKKTAVMEIQEQWANRPEFDFNLWLYDNIDRLIEKEKQQVTDAFVEGWKRQTDAKRYYNQTFGQ